MPRLYDVACYDRTDRKIVIIDHIHFTSSNLTSNITSRYMPIAIVVAKGFSETDFCKCVSLVNMSTITPNSGHIDDTTDDMLWTSKSSVSSFSQFNTSYQYVGGYMSNSSFKYNLNLMDKYGLDSDGEGEYTVVNRAEVPVYQGTSSVGGSSYNLRSLNCNDAWFMGASNYRVNTAFTHSPYSGSIRNNDIVEDVDYAGRDYRSCTCDLDGKKNTNNILTIVNNESTHWQTAGIQTTGCQPAMVCWRFKPEDNYGNLGTSQGDWYLPSIGELGYMLLGAIFIDDICSNISKNDEYNSRGIYVDKIRSSSHEYWSSTTDDLNNYVWGVNTSYASNHSAQIWKYSLSEKLKVRAFINIPCNCYKEI